jgi:AcrR family transcriptional regulator
VIRADARENRSRIMEAARAAFTDGADVSMNQIAQRACVGPGTLYRNFPTREALVLAIYEADIQSLVASVPDLLAKGTPLQALRAWTTALVDAMAKKHGLGDALSPGGHQAAIEQSYGPVIAAISRLLEAGQQDGSIRDDVDPRDFLQLTGALWRATIGPQDRSQQMLTIILDGLRPALRERDTHPRR